MTWPIKPKPESIMGIMGASLLCLFLTSCVSMQRNRRDINEAYIRGLQRARSLAYYDHCNDTVKLINRGIEDKKLYGGIK